MDRGGWWAMPSRGVTKELDATEHTGKNVIAIRLYWVYFVARMLSFDIILGR